jgi:hypothetical protein
MPLSGSKRPDRPVWHRPDHGGHHDDIHHDDDHHGGHDGHPGIEPSFPPLPIIEPPVRAGTVTDETGKYKLLLPPGDYFVAAVAEGYEWQAQEVEGLQTGQTVQVDFALQPTATIQ